MITVTVSDGVNSSTINSIDDSSLSASQKTYVYNLVLSYYTQLSQENLLRILKELIEL